MLNKLRLAREKAGLTQSEMGRKLGLTLAGYRQKEVGERKISVEEANKMVKILGTTLDEIFLNSNNQND